MGRNLSTTVPGSSNYLTAGNKIVSSSMINQFVANVTNRITSGIYHAGNVPTLNGYECIPQAYLGNLSIIPKPSFGNPGEKISSAEIYNEFMKVMQVLRYVGHFNYSLYLSWSKWGTAGSGSGSRFVASKDGYALFSKSYSESRSKLNNPANNLAGSTISVSALNALLQNCIAVYNTSSNSYDNPNSPSIPSYDKSHTYCHSSCYYDCHSDCHSDCHNDCHGNGSSCNSGYCTCYDNCGVYTPNCY